MSAVTKPIILDETGKRIATALESIAEGSQSNPVMLDETFCAMLDGTNTTSILMHWWQIAKGQGTVYADDYWKYAIMERWFKMLQTAWSGKQYTVQFGDYRVTGASAGTPLDDLADKMAAVCATDTTANDFDWADEDPMTWYIRANALSRSDGTMHILAIEGLDDAFDISGNLAPVYTFRLGLFKRQWTDGSYEYKSWRTTQQSGFYPWAADVAPAGNTHRVIDWQATFPGSLTSDGKLTSGSGFHGQTWGRNSNVTAIGISANAGITKARLWNAYEGLLSDTDLEVILDLFQMRHFNLENSGIIEGCLSYNLDYTVAVAEEGVTSVVVTTAQGANILIGSFLDVGTSARGSQITRGNVLSKETVTIDGTDYCRVHLDLPAEVDVTEGAHVCTLPWTPGSTEHLPGHKDGSIYNCTNGKTPARIAGVEIIDGAYAVGLDPLWMSDYNADRNPQSIYTVYQCRDSENQAGSITANYVASGTFQSAATGWQYIKHFEIRRDGMMVPEVVGGSSTTYLKSAFYFDAAAGLRCPWRFMILDSGGRGGSAGANGYRSPSSAAWGERPRLSGSGKKRGEWAA